MKVEFLDRLAAAGLRVLEATSFVHPKWVPQLADAGRAAGPAASGADGVDYPVLVPNERGLDRALAAGVAHVAIFASATETFAQRNLNRTLDAQFAMFEPVVTRALGRRPAGPRLRVDVLRRPVGGRGGAGAGGRGRRGGCVEHGLRASSRSATRSAPARRATSTPCWTPASRPACPSRQLAVHFHDTYGQALANTLAALRRGVTTVDASAGGLGGCPYAESATGNLATEDLVWMLDGLGIAHGVDLDALVARARGWPSGSAGRRPSRVVRALAGLAILSVACATMSRNRFGGARWRCRSPGS